MPLQQMFRDGILRLKTMPTTTGTMAPFPHVNSRVGTFLGIPLVTITNEVPGVQERLIGKFQLDGGSSQSQEARRTFIKLQIPHGTNHLP